MAFARYKKTYSVDLLSDDPSMNVQYAAKAVKRDVDDILKYMASMTAHNLAEIAADFASNEYIRAGTKMGDDDFDAYVDVEDIDGGARVIASGEDVYFMEFGIGKDVSPEGADFAEQSGVDVTPGSWSSLHKGPYSKYKHWHYKKKDYTGVPGSHGMFHALQKIEQVADKEIRRTLGDI